MSDGDPSAGPSAAFVVPGYNAVQMPALPLTDAEVEALIAFLLDPRERGTPTY